MQKIFFPSCHRPLFTSHRRFFRVSSGSLFFVLLYTVCGCASNNTAFYNVFFARRRSRAHSYNFWFPLRYKRRGGWAKDDEMSVKYLKLYKCHDCHSVNNESRNQRKRHHSALIQWVRRLFFLPFSSLLLVSAVTYLASSYLVRSPHFSAHSTWLIYIIRRIV